ncbi:MAG: KAP family NTPase, partial [Kangiellaceae bacterium]|nr:KAP family NTPase [Kangiellaceae bacterium]
MSKDKKSIKGSQDPTSYSLHPESISSTSSVAKPSLSTTMPTNNIPEQKTVAPTGKMQSSSGSLKGNIKSESKIGVNVNAAEKESDSKTGNISQTLEGFTQSAIGSVSTNKQNKPNISSPDYKNKNDVNIELKPANIKLEALKPEVVATSVDGDKTRVTANAINDSATVKDAIGFEPYVNALSKMIVHKNTQTPLVVGLYGPWGSGKTSFMKQVDAKVNKTVLVNGGDKKSKDVNRSIFFEAWQYQNTKNLSGALLFDILKGLENKNFWRSALFRVKNAFQQFNLAAVLWNLLLFVLVIYFLRYSDGWEYLVGLPLIGLFLNKESHEFIKGLKVPMGIDVSKLIKTNDDSMQTTALHDFKPELKKIIDSFVPKGGRLILYIDDLDRCIPSQVVSILETLSVLFDSDRCVFLLGIDKPKVIRAIEAHYNVIAEQTNNALMVNEKKYGEAFLEKIVQLAIVVPALNKKSIEGFANSLIDDFGTSNQETDDSSSNSDSKHDDL